MREELFLISWIISFTSQQVMILLPVILLLLIWLIHMKITSYGVYDAMIYIIKTQFIKFSEIIIFFDRVIFKTPDVLMLVCRKTKYIWFSFTHYPNATRFSYRTRIIWPYIIYIFLTLYITLMTLSLVILFLNFL